ncbi:MAG: Fic family protein [Thermoflexales bacterium]|nr:Fic family protein [Thermoflexales bacterium]
MSNDESAKIGYKWSPITDLPEDWNSMCNPELYSLASVWAEQHSQLKESRAVKEFNERLLREWSIETGILERLYTIDRGVTQLLIEQGIDAALIPHGTTDRPAAELVNILQDHRITLEGLFDFVSSRQPLTISYIRQLHQTITQSQRQVEGIDMFGNPVHFNMLYGEWKKLPNNPNRPDGLIHEYCPPLQVTGEMERLVHLFQSNQDVSPEIRAAWIHHRFTQIHPFQDGNGRVARALATLVFLQAGWFPLIINRDQRSEYIVALEAADAGDLKSLVMLFGQNAKRSFARALELSEDVLQTESTLSKVVDDLVGLYKMRRRATEKAYKGVEELAGQLYREARLFLVGVAKELQHKVADVQPAPLVIHVSSNKAANDYWYYNEIVQTANKLDYWANLTSYRRWVRLLLWDKFDGKMAHIVFSFHYLGKVNRGVMVCSAFIRFPESRLETGGNEEIEPQLGEVYSETGGNEEIEPQLGEVYSETEADEEIEPQIRETRCICREPFYFSYQDSGRRGGLVEEFHKWASEAVSIGLAEWAQRL